VADQFHSEANAQQYIDFYKSVGPSHDLEPDNADGDDEFFPEGSPVAEFGNQFIRSKKAGTIEFNTPANSFPENAQLYFEGGIPKDMVGMKNGDDEITFIYKENHGAPGNKDGKHNVKVTLMYQGAKDGEPAQYKGKVELGAEDDHNSDMNPKAFEGVSYQNTEVIKKYSPGGKAIRAKGSYQDTKDGGVRYTLEVQDPETKEWKKIFDHVDHGDENHDIKNYRGKSAFRSCIRIDGSTRDFDKDMAEKIKDLQRKSIRTNRSKEQQKILDMLGYGNISFKQIQSDND